MSARSSDYIDSRGRPTPAGIRRLTKLRDAISAVLTSHDDNTSMPCRVDLDGHDCCYTCGDVEVALRAVLARDDEDV